MIPYNSLLLNNFNLSPDTLNDFTFPVIEE